MTLDPEGRAILLEQQERKGYVRKRAAELIAERTEPGTSVIACPGNPLGVPCWGYVFQDSRGGYECTACDRRFFIQREGPFGYGGPKGSLAWWERPQALFLVWLALGVYGFIDTVLHFGGHPWSWP